MQIRRLIPWGIITLLGYYILPPVISDTGSGMAVLLVAFPVMVVLCGLLEGAGKSFSPFYALFAAVAFVPAIFIYYNSSAWVYAPVYGVLALMGSVFGRLMPLSRKSK